MSSKTALLVVLAVALATATPSFARFIPDRPFVVLGEQRVPHVLVVKFAASARPTYPRAGNSGDATTGISTVDQLNSAFRLRSYRRLFPGAKAPLAKTRRENLTGYCVLRFPATVDLDAAYEAYAADPNIERVEFDYYATIMRVPNDSYFSTMWALNQSQDHDIDAPEAWDITAGDPDVVLADTDTGVLYDHPDLIDNIWVNPGEDLDSDGTVWDMGDLDNLDNDGNGYKDDLIGYDFVESGNNVWAGEDGDLKDNDPKDFNGHGTHTSGTIAATTNNATGVAGVAGGFGPGLEPGCKIMCLRMGYSFNDGGWENGRTHMSYVAEAFNYAANNGATAINYSFGSSSGGGIEAATNDAIAAGVVIVASAGNGSSNNAGDFGYLQRRADVICVAATTSSDRKWGGSNWGPYVDVSAPGASVRSTVSNHYAASYAYYWGTSMATPHVVGLAGLLRSINPSLTGPQITANILAFADDIDGLNQSYAGGLGAGRINAFASVSNPAIADFSATPLVGDAPLTVSFADLSPDSPTNWRWHFGDNDSSSLQHPTHEFGAGLYDVSLWVDTPIGYGQTIKPNYIMALDEQIDVPMVETMRDTVVYADINYNNNVPLNEITLPIHASNITALAYFDSIVTTGCRTDYFERSQLFYSSPLAGNFCLYLKADNGGGSPPLAPGSGPIARAWFSIHSTATVGDSIRLTTQSMGGYDLECKNAAGDFIPEFVPGKVMITALIGDLDLSGAVNPVDVVYLVNQVYRGASPPAWPPAADTDCNGSTNPIDVVILVNTVYRGGPAPCSWLE